VGRIYGNKGLNDTGFQGFPQILRECGEDGGPAVVLLSSPVASHSCTFGNSVGQYRNFIETHSVQMKSNTKGVLLFIIFFIIGFVTYRDFFDLALPDVKGVYYIDNSFTVVFMNTLLYSLTIGLIPVFFSIVWKMSPIISVKRKFLSIVIIFVCLSMAILFGYKNVLSTANKLKAANANNLNNPTLHFPLKNCIPNSICFLVLSPVQ
jgi:hypothetical protein